MRVWLAAVVINYGKVGNHGAGDRQESDNVQFCISSSTDNRRACYQYRAPVSFDMISSLIQQEKIV